jgi:hypothetical protein
MNSNDWETQIEEYFDTGYDVPEDLFGAMLQAKLILSQASDKGMAILMTVSDPNTGPEKLHKLYSSLRKNAEEEEKQKIEELISILQLIRDYAGYSRYYFNYINMEILSLRDIAGYS